MKNFLRFKLTALIQNVALLLAAGLTNAFANTVIDCASPTSTTQTVQSSLTECSIEGSTCEIPSGATCKVSGPLYMWGNASLKSSNGGGIEFTLNPTTPNQYPYLFNLGISGPQIPVGSISNLQNPFTGKIAGVTFKLTGTSTDHGRIIYFWRTDGATVSNNVFDVGSFNYSATSSGNNQAWVHNSDINSVRRNVTISNNIINATSAGDAPLGSEGIGLGQFTSATIQGNVIRGVGDDGIALHFCSGVKILDNVLETTRGRIFIGNSDHVEIARNKHTRIASLKDNRFYVGISLLYVGFEDVQGGPSTNQWYAPSDIDIHHNELYYPFGSIDRGAAIFYMRQGKRL